MAGIKLGLSPLEGLLPPMPPKASADRDSYLRFSRPSNQCVLCGVPLNIDGRHPSLIALDAAEPVRRDFCPTCWAGMGERQYFSYWVTKRITAPSAQERRLARSERNEALWRLFVALHQSTDRELGPQLFLLAHLLMKYRVLNFIGAAGERLRFHHPKLDEFFEIDDIAIDSADFAAINRDIEQQAIALMDQVSASEES